MLGLNDRWIARNGTIIGSRAGHTRYTTLEYLLEADVNLVIGHPQVKPISTSTHRPRDFFHHSINLSLLPSTSKIIEIPLNSDYQINVLYLKRRHDIDKKIEILNLTTHKLGG